MFGKNTPHLAGQDKPVEAKPVIPTAPMVRTDEECKSIWRYVNFLSGDMRRMGIYWAFAAVAMCAGLIFVGLRREAKLQQRLDGMARGLQSQYAAIADVSANVDENHKAVAAALTPAEDCHDGDKGWRIAAMYDDLSVVRLMWDADLHEKFFGVRFDDGYVMSDRYRHLNEECYAYLKKQTLGYVDWSELYARRYRFERATKNGVVSLEVLHRFDHDAITEWHDAEHIVTVKHHFNDGSDEGWNAEIFLHLNDASYVLAKGMWELDVWKIEQEGATPDTSTNNAK